MTAPTWITERTVLAIHDRLRALDGGTPDLRDAGPLASALARPQQHHADRASPDVVRLAALYTDAIPQHHRFVDGNKRVDFAVGVLFLDLHGYERFVHDHAQPARDP